MMYMRLNLLKIKNFRVIKSFDLNFTDKVIGIVGPNGAGKSSIIEAISWALYGNQASRTGKDGIKSVFAGRDDDCLVTLDFTIRNEKYRITRRLAGRNGRVEVELNREQTSETVGVTDTRRYIEELIGLDWKGFCTSFLARQQELNALSDLQPFKRRDYLAGMLGIDRLDKAVQKVKEDTRLNAEKVIFLDRKLAESEQLTKRIEELISEIKTLAGQVSSAYSLYNEIKEVFEKTSGDFQNVQKVRSEWQGISARIDAVKTTLENLKDHLVKLEKERDELEAAQKEGDSLKVKIARLAVVNEEIEKLKEARNRVVRRDEIKTEIDDLNSQKKTIDEELAENQKKLTRLNSQLETLPPDIEDRLKTSDNKLNQAREEYTQKDADKKALLKELERLEKQFSAINEFGPDSVCDRCLRPLGDDLEEIKKHLNREKTELTEQLKQLETELEKKEKTGKILKETSRDLSEKSKERYKISVERDNLAKGLEEKKQNLKTITERLLKQKQQLESLTGFLFDENKFGQLNLEQKELEKTKTTFDRLQGSLQRIPAVTEDLQKTGGKVEAIEKELKELNTRQAELDFSEEKYLYLETKYRENQKKTEEAKDNYTNLRNKNELNEKELESKREQMAGLEKTARELEECRSGQYYGQKLGSLFSEFRNYLIVRIKPTLAEISSQLIKEMTSEKYSLIDLDDQYNLKLMDSGQYYDIERFSGGEKDLANLCLRLAISQALTESAGLERSFVILDEVFGSQDNDRRDLIIDALGNLKRYFPQMILVTHIEEIKNRVEELIVVEPSSNGWSNIVYGNEQD